MKKFDIIDIITLIYYIRIGISDYKNIISLIFFYFLPILYVFLIELNRFNMCVSLL